MRTAIATMLLVLAMAGCGDWGTAPRPTRLSMSVISAGDRIFVPDGEFSRPMVVRVTRGRTQLVDQLVVWDVFTPDGGLAVSSFSHTDTSGRAPMRLILWPGVPVGRYGVTARTTDRTTGDSVAVRLTISVGS